MKLPAAFSTFVIPVHLGSDATGRRFARVDPCEHCAIARFLVDQPKLPAHQRPGGPLMDAEAFSTTLAASAFADGRTQLYSLGSSRTV